MKVKYDHRSKFQLLKLENLLRWSYFTFIYNRSSDMKYFVYTSNQYHDSIKKVCSLNFTFSQIFKLLPVWSLQSSSLQSSIYTNRIAIVKFFKTVTWNNLHQEKKCLLLTCTYNSRVKIIPSFKFIKPHFGGKMQIADVTGAGYSS